jgi:hypothetical protein
MRARHTSRGLTAGDWRDFRSPAATCMHTPRFETRLRFWLGFILSTLVLGGTTFAADTEPVIELQPSTLILPVGSDSQGTAWLIVRNPGKQPLRNLRVTWLPSASLAVQSPVPSPLAELPAHADSTWTVVIKPVHEKPSAGTAAEETKIDDTLEFRLDYKTGVGNGAQSHVLLKSLAVKTRDLSDLDKIPDIQIKTSLEALDSSQSGSVYVVLTNNSTRTMQVTSIAPVGKGNLFCGEETEPPSQAQEKSLPFCFTSDFKPTMLPPYQAITQEFRVTADNRVDPGKYLLVFAATTQSYEGGTLLSRKVVATQPVDVDVLGESAILKVTSIPSFFLLPGALFLIAVVVLWDAKWLQAKTDTMEFPIKYTDPGFWLVSVTLSLLVAVLPWLYTGRWYFTSYGLQDIAILWLSAVVAGGLTYIVLEHFRMRYLERTPSEEDSPLDTLRKLKRRRKKLALDRVVLKNKAEPAFVLSGSREDDSIWICPAAKVEFGKVELGVQKEIENQLNKDSDPAYLADLLSRKGVTVTWCPTPVNRVCSVPKADIDRWDDNQDIFLQTD